MIGESIHHRELPSPTVVSGLAVGRTLAWPASCGYGVGPMVCYDRVREADRTEAGGWTDMMPLRTLTNFPEE